MLANMRDKFRYSGLISQQIKHMKSVGSWQSVVIGNCLAIRHPSFVIRHCF
jgi:hypothetical protein